VSLEVFALIAAAVAVAAFVQGTIGVGFALIVAPVLAFLSPNLVPVGLLILMLPLNFYVAYRERGALDGFGASWISFGRIFGTLGGLWVLLALPPSALNLLVGAATILAALASLLAPSFTPNRRAFVTAGVITGITETATGIGGPPLALVYQHHPAAILRSTIAACFLIGELVSLAFLAASGRVTLGQVTMAAVLVPSLALGGLLSQAVHRRLDGRRLRISVLAFALVSGAVLLLRG
jgi:uncharacterized membrane protein YfcA